tara:strand:- start:55 stop:279 length:225 start_codon:yes stop_codon:yes gene_type:complete
MTLNEIYRVQEYLRRTFANENISVVPPDRPNGPVEVHISGEFIGTLHRDEDEGEVSYDLNIAILSEDLPAAASM